MNIQVKKFYGPIINYFVPVLEVMCESWIALSLIRWVV